MSLNTKNVTQTAQLKAESTEVLNQYAGALGQLVFDKSTEHMHVMKGEVGQNVKMANFADIAAHAYSKGESDGKFALKTETYKKSETYSRSEIDSKVAGAYIYRGTKANLAEIQKVEDIHNGDVYNAEDSGMNYAWNGSKWDALGSTVDVSGFISKDEVSRTYATKAEMTSELGKKLGKSEKAASAATADKAVQDGQGRVIVDVYLTKEEATSKYQAKGNYLTPESTIDYAKIVNVPKIVDYGTLTA